MADTGGPAFPRTAAIIDRKIDWHQMGDDVDGMSLLDYFAGQAIQGIIRRGMNATSDFITCDAVSAAWNFAEAMTAERKKRYG